jgi:hypothetical protein
MHDFSRTFDKKHYDNALKIYENLKKTGYTGGMPKVTSYEIFEDSFKQK